MKKKEEIEALIAQISTEINGIAGIRNDSKPMQSRDKLIVLSLDLMTCYKWISRYDENNNSFWEFPASSIEELELLERDLMTHLGGSVSQYIKPLFTNSLKEEFYKGNKWCYVDKKPIQFK